MILVHNQDNHPLAVQANGVNLVNNLLLARPASATLLYSKQQPLLHCSSLRLES